MSTTITSSNPIINGERVFKDLDLNFTAHPIKKDIVKHTNVTCMLTTHYVQLCKKLHKNARIQNYHMKTFMNDGNTQLINYTYLLKILGGTLSNWSGQFLL